MTRVDAVRSSPGLTSNPATAARPWVQTASKWSGLMPERKRHPRRGLGVANQRFGASTRGNGGGKIDLGSCGRGKRNAQSESYRAMKPFRSTLTSTCCAELWRFRSFSRNRTAAVFKDHADGAFHLQGRECGHGGESGRHTIGSHPPSALRHRCADSRCAAPARRAEMSAP